MSLLGLLGAIAAHGSLPLLVFASTFGSIGAPAYNAWLLFREHPWLLPARHAYKKESARRIIRLGLLFFALQCGIIIGYTSDNLVITQILGVAAVSMYAVPQKLFGVVSGLVTTGLSPVWPAYGEAIARGDVAWVRTAFVRSVRIVMSFVFPTCVFLVLAGPWILRVAMGKTLHVSMSLLVALGVWGVVSTISPMVSFLLNGAGIMKEQAILSIIASLCNLALSIVLTRRFGVIGVCLGSIISQLGITLPVYLFLIQRLFRNLEMGKTGLKSKGVVVGSPAR
jgi:O-antigen/teichoic acid export membrane protein